MHRPWRLQSGAALLAALALATAARAELYLIVHPGTAIAPRDVVPIFTGEKQFAGPQRLMPVDNAAVHDEFLGAVLRVDAGRYEAMWIRKSFRDGINQPPMKSGDLEVLEFVRRTPGAVGYTHTVRTGVSILERY